MNRTIFETQVTFYPSILGKESKTETLSRLLLSRRWRGKVEAVRAESDPDRRKELKNALPAFTPSGIFEGREANTLRKHSGFICIDIDAKDNAGVENFDDLKSLVAANPHVTYCGVSVGGKGYFCIIPVADTTKHREYFRALAHDFKRCGVTIDRQCGNVNRLRFVSYDPAPYVNTGALAYDYILPEREGGERKAEKVLGRKATDAETLKIFHGVLDRIRESHTDITGDYGQWFEILCAVASTFGEDGREYAHTISSAAACYDPEETDAQFTMCLKRGGYDYTLGTFFHYAKQYAAAMDFSGFMEGGDNDG